MNLKYKSWVIILKKFENYFYLYVCCEVKEVRIYLYIFWVFNKEINMSFVGF